MEADETQDFEITPELYQEVLENYAAGLIFVRAEDGTICFVDSTIEAMFGYEPGELQGKHISTINSSEEEAAEETAKKIMAALAENKVWQGEVLNAKKDGTSFWTYAYVSLYEHPKHGKLWVTLQGDISEQKRVEEQLRALQVMKEAEDRIRESIALMAGPQDLIRVISEIKLQLANLEVPFDGLSIQIVNMQGTDFVAVSDGLNDMEVLMGRELLHKEPGHAAIHPWVLKVWKSGKARHMSRTDLVGGAPQIAPMYDLDLIDVPFSHGTLAIHSRTPGTYNPSHVERLERIAALLSEGFQRFITLSERIHLQEDLSKIQNLKFLGVLAGGIAHDFNNVLSGVIGGLSILDIRLPKGSVEHQAVCDALNAAIRATELARQLLTFARGGNPVKVPVAIAKLLNEHTELALSGTRTKALYELPADLPDLTVDPEQIGQVVYNLATNADQAMVSGGMLYVSAQKVKLFAQDPRNLLEGEYIKLTFRDEGVGMSPEVKRQIFDPYFTTKEMGHGLGLAIVFSIVKKHGGHVEVHSTPGSGSQFEILLPTAAPSAGNEQKKPYPKRNTSGRILLMDDEEIIHASLGPMIQLMGFQVDSAYDGREALQLYEKAEQAHEPYSLVIMDLTIAGGMGGVEAAKKLRQRDPQAKILVASGYADDPILVDYRAYGFEGAIAKPITFKDLASAIGAFFPVKEPA